jgi:hypothetical protein
MKGNILRKTIIEMKIDFICNRYKYNLNKQILSIVFDTMVDYVQDRMSELIHLLRLRYLIGLQTPLQKIAINCICHVQRIF